LTPFPVSPPAGRAPAVLVVDDEEALRDLLRSALSSLGCTVETAPDGAAAAALFRTTPFDLVLLDLHMPGLSGPETARILRGIEREEGRPRTVLIALTGEELPPGKWALEGEGFDGFRRKPLRLEELRALLAGVPGEVEASPPPAKAFPESLRPLADLAGGDPAIMREAVNLFLGQLPEMLDRIDRSGPEDPDLVLLLHRLKGSVALLGDSAATERVRTLYERTRAGQTRDLVRDRIRLRQALEGVARRFSDDRFWDELTLLLHRRA